MRFLLKRVISIISYLSNNITIESIILFHIRKKSF